jgi:hypothetical protein
MAYGIHPNQPAYLSAGDQGPESIIQLSEATSQVPKGLERDFNYISIFFITSLK